MQRPDMHFDKPTLVTITAPTCSGKSYLLDLMTLDPGYRQGAKPFVPLFDRIVGTTTRAPRPGEKDGVHYHFLTPEKSAEMEANGEFAELVEFRGNRYGVTKAEMATKMKGERAPIMILEPQGLAIYEKLCRENGWEIFKIYMYTLESVRIQRLNDRTSIDARDAAMAAAASHDISMLEDIEKIVATHTSRLLSITGEERRWQNASSWDVLIPGDDTAKAIKDIEQGIKWRNSQNARLNT